MSYIFLKKHNPEHETGEFFAIPATTIETLNYFETYDQYGQQIGHENAADTHPENPYSELNLLYQTWLEENHLPGAPADMERFESDHEISLCKCEGFNYWDGNNQKSIITAIDYADEAVTHEIIEDEELIKKLNEAIENMKEISDERGITTHDAGDYIVTESQFASDPFSYTIMTAENYAYLKG